ncbi:MAG: S-layer homology domain-containing protein [Clostridiales bacterium]|nr:S-layer homology domain-containing protein [Clostridiales bacterium]
MKDKFRKFITRTAVAVLAAAVVLPGTGVLADSGVKIDAAYFPDSNFRKYIKSEFDQDSDGFLSSGEISDADLIDITGTKVKNLTGLNYFTSLEILECSGLGLTELDVSSNTKLKTLIADANKLTVIDVTKNKDLTELIVDDNKLESLNVSKNRSLYELSCSGNLLKELNFKNNPALGYLDCSDNAIYKITFAEGSHGLTTFNCASNELERISLPNASSLTTVRCEDNHLNYLDLSDSYKLMYLTCYQNNLSAIKLSESLQDTPYIDSASNVYHVEVDCNRQFDISDMPSGFEADRTFGWEGATRDGNTVTVEPANTTVTYFYNMGSAMSATFTIDVTNPYCLSVSGSAIDLLPGKYVYLTTDYPIDNWTTSDKSVVSINSRGKAVAKKAGYAEVTANLTDGNTVVCKITVQYKDVTNKKDFWYTPTYALTALDIVKGYDKQTLFKPENNCTRAQMVTFIWRLAGCPEPDTKECKFSDIKKSDYFYKAVLWGNEKHIVEGYKDGTFGPQIVCTRKHAVTFLWRLAGKPVPTSPTCKFKDVKATDYFYQAVIWASEKNIVAGYKDGTFKPSGECTRRQMVTFLYKYNKTVNKAG